MLKKGYFFLSNTKNGHALVGGVGVDTNIANIYNGGLFLYCVICEM
jgi:hypothetical protein